MHAASATWQIRTLSLLVAVMPACFAVSTHIKPLFLAVLFLTGMVLLATRDQVRLSYRLAWPVAAVCALRLLYDLANFVGHGLGWQTLDLPSQILLFLAIAAVFALPLRQRIVAIGFSLTTFLLGFASLYQRYIEGADRAYGLNGGTWASVEFAMYILVLVLFSMLQALRPTTSRADRLFHGAAVLVGLYGAVLTQSRGPLLAFAPVFLGLMLWHAWRSQRWRQALALLVITVAGMLAITATLHSEMADRLADVPMEIASYSPADTTGAVRERIEMWQVAWHAFSQHPMTGIGLDQFGEYVKREAAIGQASQSIVKYVHPHSEYLESMVAGGVPALLVLLLFFGVPLVFFARRINHPQEAVASYAIAGLMLVSMYALCALTDNVLYRAMPHSLYLYLVLGLAVSIGRQLHNASSR